MFSRATTKLFKEGNNQIRKIQLSRVRGMPHPGGGALIFVKPAGEKRGAKIEYSRLIGAASALASFNRI